MAKDTFEFIVYKAERNTFSTTTSWRTVKKRKKQTKGGEETLQDMINEVRS